MCVMRGLSDLGVWVVRRRYSCLSSAYQERNLVSRRWTASEIKDAVQRLDTRLRSWYAELRQEYRLRTTHTPRSLSPRITHIHFLYLQHSFYGSLCVLH